MLYPDQACKTLVKSPRVSSLRIPDGLVVVHALRRAGGSVRGAVLAGQFGGRPRGHSRLGASLPLLHPAPAQQDTQQAGAAPAVLCDTAPLFQNNVATVRD